MPRIEFDDLRELLYVDITRPDGRAGARSGEPQSAHAVNAYRRNGVREYIVHRTYDGEVDWFILRDGHYDRLMPDAQGIVRSEVFPGLWRKPGALVAGALAEVLHVLREGAAAAGHAEFCTRLADRAARSSGDNSRR